jgi:hypothetical protein
MFFVYVFSYLYPVLGAFIFLGTAGNEDYCSS